VVVADPAGAVVLGGWAAMVMPWPAMHWRKAARLATVVVLVVGAVVVALDAADEPPPQAAARALNVVTASTATRPR
jgi:hypothetical protein